MCLAHPPITRQHLAHMMGLRRQARDPPDVPPAHREHGGGGMTVESGRRKERERERERKRENEKSSVSLSTGELPRARPRSASER